MQRVLCAARRVVRFGAIRCNPGAMKRFAPLFLFAFLSSTQPACYGSYSAFHKVHGWNGTVTGNKVANSAIHFALWLGIYELVLVGDFLIFNNVEFVTGKPVF